MYREFLSSLSYFCSIFDPFEKLCGLLQSPNHVLWVHRGRRGLVTASRDKQVREAKRPGQEVETVVGVLLGLDLHHHRALPHEDHVGEARSVHSEDDVSAVKDLNRPGQCFSGKDHQLPRPNLLPDELDGLCLPDKSPLSLI